MMIIKKTNEGLNRKNCINEGKNIYYPQFRIPLNWELNLYTIVYSIHVRDYTKGQRWR
jgi:hypothetical protein